MKWNVDLGRQDARHGLIWARRFFDQFDTTKVEWVRINHGNNQYEGVYGHCHMPTKKRATFRLSCQLPGPFPCNIVTRRPPLYARPDGTFPHAPRGCRRGLLCSDPRTGRAWYRLLSKTNVQTIDEALVWIVAHEAFHWLRQTRQIDGRNTEIEADRFADDQMSKFCNDVAMARPVSVLASISQFLLPWSR